MELDNAELARKKEARKKNECFNCGKPGHYAKNCRSKGKTSAKFTRVEEVDQEPQEEELIHIQDTAEELLRFNGLINGHPAWILLDSGASRNFISETFVKKKKMTITKAKPFKVEFANRTKLQVSQEVRIQELHLDEYYASDLPAQVINLKHYDAILGKP